MNEERDLLTAMAKILEDGLPQEYARPVPTSFQVNRFDALNPGTKLCMVDISNTGGYEPLPDQENYASGGIAIKTIEMRVYIFANVMNIENVNVGTAQEPGLLDCEAEVLGVLFRQPFFNLDTQVLRWKVTSVNREAWKQLDTLVGATIALAVEMGEREKLNP